MKRTEFLKLTEQRLVKRRDALRRALAGDVSLLRAEHELTVGDEIDAAVASEQAEIRSQMASYETRELAQIESALQKIRGGHYGHCETCEKPIAPPRLKALPYATECISCARRDERRPAGQSGPVNRIAAYDVGGSEPALDEEYEEIG